MKKYDAERVIEALLFTSSEPLSIKGLKKKFPHDVDIESIIEILEKRYESRGVNLKRVGDSVVLRTAKDLHHLFITKEVTKRNLSRAARETLAIIAYHQPVTKLEIEEIRGVSVGSGTIDLLMDLDWIKFGRRKSSPGRPITFQITDIFLDYFDLSSTKDLPGIKELRDLGLSVKKLNRV
ncbi:MAG: SMC-Scp complex subunit ScpB [Paracoccaceae bacterium]